MNTEQQGLTIKEKIAYALGDTAANIAWRSIGPFLPIFYTDVFGLGTAAVATLLFVIRLGDGITDVLMGMLADRTRSRWGKFRPWLFWTALPFAVALVLQFTTPNLSLSGKLIWAYATSIFYTLAYTANNVPYSALMGVMTADVQERTSLSSYRFFGAYLGGIIATVGIITLVDFLGNGDENLGYQYTMYVLASILCLFSFITFLGTKERVPYPESSKIQLKEDLKDLLQNRSWIILLFIGFVFVTYNIIKGSTTMYYFNHYVEEKDHFLAGLSHIAGKNGLAGLYLLSLLLVSMLSTFFAPWLTRILGKRRLFVICILSSSLFAALMYLLSSSAITEIFVLGMLSEFGAGIMPVLFFAMLGDSADYSEYKNGRRATGLVYSAGTFAMKFGSGVAGAITLLVLNLYSYDGLAEQKTAEMLQGIRLNMSIVPAVFILLGLIALFLYPLTETKMKEVQQALQKRRTGEGQ